MAAHDVDYEWWETSCNYFRDVFKEVFNADLITEDMDCWLFNGRYISFNVLLFPTPSSLQKAELYADDEVRKLASQLNNYCGRAIRIANGAWNSQDGIMYMDTHIEHFSKQVAEWMLYVINEEWENQHGCA